MLLNRVEYALMNSPFRAVAQRRFEAKRLLFMGGPMSGGLALEIGCGRGVGIEIILDVFGAEGVDAFDLDPRMVELAKRRTRHRGDQVTLWRGDVTTIPIDDEHYDAVFDFAMIHHVPNWRAAVSEVYRVLKPGGRLYAEEPFGKVLTRFPWRQLFNHPQEDRFDHAQFGKALGEAGFSVVTSTQLHGASGWFTADKMCET
jgi:ubiquinone/menaquinone biosynthesis C-methylase UbiE